MAVTVVGTSSAQQSSMGADIVCSLPAGVQTMDVVMVFVGGFNGTPSASVNFYISSPTTNMWSKFVNERGPQAWLFCWVKPYTTTDGTSVTVHTAASSEDTSVVVVVFRGLTPVATNWARNEKFAYSDSPYIIDVGPSASYGLESYAMAVTAIPSGNTFTTPDGMTLIASNTTGSYYFYVWGKELGIGEVLATSTYCASSLYRWTYSFVWTKAPDLPLFHGAF